MNIAIVGCGFVSDYYLVTLRDYPHINLQTVYDRDPARSAAAANREGVKNAESLDEILNDSNIELVLNLTNPRDHYEVSSRLLEAGKHVYSEKPFAMDLEKCEALYRLAKKMGLYISSAPCSLLGESAQTMKKAIEDGKIGKVRLVYAEMDDGPIYQMQPETWKSASGLPWPIRDEYEVGCTLEHAGYCLNWLVGIFGEITTIHAFADCLMEDKGIANLSPSDTPDYSVANIKFKCGVVARITCSIIAPHNHEIKVIGDDGILKIDESWHYGSSVKYQKASLIAHKAERYTFIRNSRLLRFIFGLSFSKLAFVAKPKAGMRFKKDYMDYARGVSDMIQAINNQSKSSINAAFSLHVNEAALAIHYARENNGFYIMKTKLDNQ